MRRPILTGWLSAAGVVGLICAASAFADAVDDEPEVGAALTGRSIYQHVQEFKEITAGRNVIKRNGGSHQEDEIRQGYSAQGWPIFEPFLSNDVKAGIQRVFGMHSLNKIYVFNDLTEYLREKLSYAYQKKDGITLDEIEHKNRFHLMDAERYILSDFAPVAVGDAAKTEIHRFGVAA